MMTTLRASLLISVLTLCNALQAQEGTLDPTFNGSDLGYGYGDGASDTVHAVSMQSDGRIIIGGSFTYYNGIYRSRIARLNINGGLDTGFSPSVGANNAVLCIAVQPDGKIILGGRFTTYDGVARNHLARLNADGSLDATFNPGSGTNGSKVSTITLQPDGKFLISGIFSTYNGTPRARIARITNSGSLDTSFDPGTGPTNEVLSATIQPDGKYIITGTFLVYGGIARDRIVRINADGTVDMSFNATPGPSSTVSSTTLQPDGKVIVSGSFTLFNGVSRNCIARLNADGSLDPSFDPGTGANGIISSTALQPDGKIIARGTFATFNGFARNSIVRLATDGVVDTSFLPWIENLTSIRAMALQSDLKIIVCGDAPPTDAGPRVIRLSTDGSLESNFNPGTGANAAVLTAVTQPDEKILIGGAFTRYGGAVRHCVARVNSDGTLDPGFEAGYGANGTVLSLSLRSNGKFIIAGNFTAYNSILHNRIVQLEANGAWDPGFDPGSGANAQVRCTAIQSDGKVIVGGDFTSFNGVARSRIARLNPDGSLDGSFDPGIEVNQPLVARVHAIAIQPDGKILFAGVFTSVNGTSRNRIARLNSDGSMDSSFDPGSGFNNGWNNSAPLTVVIQPDGKLLVGGDFGTYNGAACNGIARLNSDGSLDASFLTGTGANLSVYAIVLQPDGRIIITGLFTVFNGWGRGGVARLKTNGNLDLGFSPAGLGASNSIIHTASLQVDGKIIVGGNFTSYDNTGRNRIARLRGTSRASIRVLLEGPFAGGSMSDALRTLPSFPLTEPFAAMGYSEAGYVAGATSAPSVLSVIGNNAIVDWVIVEMRPAATPNLVAASRAVLLQRDGDVVDLDGVSSVGFSGLAHGNYCVVVKPRNHLPVMLSPSTPFAYGTSTATVDFTLPSTQVYDNDARKNVGGVMLLQAGDVTFNEELRYVGFGNDRDPILTRIGGSTPTATVSGYWPEDVNMDGVVKYVGANNDRDVILLNVGGSTPTAVRNAQLP